MCCALYIINNYFKGHARLCSAIGSKSDYGFKACEFDQAPYFCEINHEIFSKVIVADSRRTVVTYKRRYVHGVLDNCLD